MGEYIIIMVCSKVVVVMIFVLVVYFWDCVMLDMYLVILFWFIRNVWYMLGWLFMCLVIVVWIVMCFVLELEIIVLMVWKK